MDRIEKLKLQIRDVEKQHRGLMRHTNPLAPVTINTAGYESILQEKAENIRGMKGRKRVDIKQESVRIQVAFINHLEQELDQKIQSYEESLSV